MVDNCKTDDLSYKINKQNENCHDCIKSLVDLFDNLERNLIENFLIRQENKNDFIFILKLTNDFVELNQNFVNSILNFVFQVLNLNLGIFLI